MNYGLRHSYVDKNKNVKKNVATELESLSIILDKYINPTPKENFHEYLRGASNTITKNIYNDHDNTFKSLTKLRKNENIIVLSADKESCTVILSKADYVNKANKMIDEGIASGKYVETSDTTYTNLKRFQDSLYRHFKDKKCYDEIHLVSNQPARFFATAKTHKFKSLEEINVDQLKLLPIVDQTGTYIYNASKVIAKYLIPLAKNEFSISGTFTFPDLVKNASNSNKYEHVSYGIESLFTSIPVEETINYIVDIIYIRKKTEPLWKSRYLKKICLS